MEFHAAIHGQMAAMLPMEIWIEIVVIFQGSEGVSSIIDGRVRRVSGNRSRAVFQLVGKCGIEEEVKDNISCQEK